MSKNKETATINLVGEFYDCDGDPLGPTPQLDELVDDMLKTVNILSQVSELKFQGTGITGSNKKIEDALAQQQKDAQDLRW